MFMYRTLRAKFIFLLIMCLINNEKNVCTAISCNDDYVFYCDSGDQCIDSIDLCDGHRDCNDGSDETVKNCIGLRKQCPSYSFLCTYGGCISDGLQCNGKPECADGSDEVLGLCNPTELAKEVRGRCGDFEMNCKSGECKSIDDLCDGKLDCKDGSDETIALCASTKCPALSFQCGYGACVEGTAVCNHINDCADGSDETPQLCENITRTTTTITTTVTPPIKGQTQISKCTLIYSGSNIIITNAISHTIMSNGDTVPKYGAINFACNSGYSLKGYNQTRCNIDGTWTKEFPICFKFCSGKHPKSGFSTVATFQYNGHDVSNLYAFEPQTVATIACAQGYNKGRFFQETLTCEKNGWSPYKQPCWMDCGKPSVPIQEYSYGGTPINVTQVPWHVGLYNRTGNSYKNICGGTIISPRLIVSAAHCFFDPQKPFTGLRVDSSTFKIAAGKFYREYNSNEPIPYLVQKLEIIDVWIHPDYIGKDKGFYRDISIITLAEFLVFSDMVRPICLDFPQEHLKAISSGVKGYFSAFSQLSISNPESSLQRLDMTTLSRIDCENEIKGKPDSTLTSLPGDKFCLASYGDSYACRGDSGNGFVVYNPNTHQYILRGLISFSPSRTQECSVNSLLVLTNINFYETQLQTNVGTDIKNDILVS